MRSDDLHLLALTDPVTADDLKRRYRELAMTTHPDRGGDPQSFAELSAAYERLMVEAAKPQSCTECQGRGVVRFGSGFNTAWQACPRCRLTRKT